MSKTTTDLIPGNILNRVRNLERRMDVVERLVRRDETGGVAPLYLIEVTTGLRYRLECEFINGEVSLFLAPAGEGGAG